MNQTFIIITVVIATAFYFCLGKESKASGSTNPHKGGSIKTEQVPIKNNKAQPMASETHLPLRITSDMPLNDIELMIGFYSSKTGAGRQEIIFLADGTVKLFYSRSYDDSNPEIIEAKCSSEQVLRLFDFLEGMGFFGLPDEFSSSTQSHARRLLKFSMPGRQKVVAVDEPGNYAIEQCIGAIKLSAGLCIPEAINHRFFPNL